jgi:ornithine cyclodeaminase/alanine dehydrogenase-like protein (mu-crystallin family)
MTAPIVVSRSEIAALLPLPECIAAVEQALRLAAEGAALPSRALGVETPEGGFHVKTSGLSGERAYFAAKINANFPGNPTSFGLPTIQGALLLFDAAKGSPLAIMDSGEITRLRTAAATAVAARHLARADSRIATIVGCGVQGRAHLEALLCVLPLQRVYAVDRSAAAAASFAREASAALNIAVEPAADLGKAVQASDVCVTCTTSRAAILPQADVARGCFVAAVGADNPHKQELDPALMAASTVVVDSLDQCAEIGDLRCAIAAGAMRRAQVHAELADVVAGRKPGRSSRDEIIVFDSTGIALEDAAAGVAVFERAMRTGNCRSVLLAE